MPYISYPTKISESGPWLLDDKQLSALDAVFDEFRERLQEEKSDWIHRTTDEDYRDELQEINDATKLADRRKYLEKLVSTSRLDPDRRRLTILMKGGRSLAAGSFAEALRHAETANEKALGFYYNCRVGKIEASVDIQNEWPLKDLSISVEPASNQLAREFFGALRNWAEDAQSQPWVRWWFLARNTCRVLLLIWVVTGFLFSLVPWTDSATVHKERAHKLLEKGITQQNANDAIATLLAIDSEYPAQNVQRPSKANYWKIYLSGASLLTLLSICPKICLGIWAGKRSLFWWRIWVNLIWVTIPGSVLWRWLVALLLKF
jgi:hypothetical protein